MSDFDVEIALTRDTEYSRNKWVTIRGWATNDFHNMELIRPVTRLCNGIIRGRGELFYDQSASKVVLGLVRMYENNLLFLSYLYSMQTNAIVSFRKKEIVNQYISELDRHIQSLKNGDATKVFEIRDFAALLHVHPVHLSNTIKEVTGRSTCDLFEERLLNLAKELLLTSNSSIGQIAHQLTYDPSNFTKFFKAYTGMTPGQFRNLNRKS